MAQLVITRARLRSFLAWIIMVMADLKAFGTSSDAPERTAANGRKVSGETLKSVVSFLGETTPTTTTISDIESLLNVRFNTLLCNVKNLLQKSKMLMNQLFDEVSERSERAFRKTSIIAMNPAYRLQTLRLHSTTELTPPTQFVFVWLARFALASLLNFHLASLGAAPE